MMGLKLGLPTVQRVSSFVGQLDSSPNVVYADSMRVLYSSMVNQPLFRLYGVTSTEQSDFKIATPNIKGWGVHINSLGQTIAQWMAANSDTVARFIRKYDQSTNGVNFREQTTASSMTTYSEDAMGSGYPGEDWMAQNAEDSFDSVISQSGGHVLYATCFQDSSASGYDMYLQRDGSAAAFYFLNKKLHVYNIVGTQSATTVEAKAVCRWRNKTNSGVRINLGSEVTGAVYNNTLNWTGISSAAGSQWFKGYAGENILFSALPANDTELVNNMADAWGITL